MHQDDFIIHVYIIHVYCQVCQAYDHVVSSLPHRLRRGGLAPGLSDCEVITMEVCGELLKMNSDKDLFHHFKTHYQDWFPALQERSRFVRQAANLWQVKAQIQRLLVAQSRSKRRAARRSAVH